MDINLDIARTSQAFRRLNARRWAGRRDYRRQNRRTYRRLKPAAEARLVALAERLARLYRFQGWMWVRNRTL